MFPCSIFRARQKRRSDTALFCYPEAATDFIRSLLAGGRRLASDCEAKLEAAGFKKSTYKKSKKKAGVRSVKDGFLWYWTLPEVEKPIENGQEVTDEDDLPI